MNLLGSSINSTESVEESESLKEDEWTVQIGSWMER